MRFRLGCAPFGISSSAFLQSLQEHTRPHRLYDGSDQTTHCDPNPQLERSMFLLSSCCNSVVGSSSPILANEEIRCREVRRRSAAELPVPRVRVP